MLGTILAKISSVVISTLRLFPSRDERHQLLAILHSVQGPTQVQPGCQSCRVYEENGLEGAILYMERWESEPAMERHVRSEVYRRILAAVEFSRKPPEIAFDFAATSRGIDLIEVLRSEGECKSQ